MIQDFGLLFGYILAFVMFMMAFLNGRKTARMEAMLKDAAKRFNLGKDAYKKLQQEYQNTLTKEAEQRQKVKKLEQTLFKANQDLNQINQEIAGQKEFHQANQDALALKVSHLSEEAEVLKEQLRLATQEKLAAGQALQSRSQSEATSLKKQLQETSKAYEELRKQYMTLNQDTERLRGILAKIDPATISKTRRRAHRMEQLYVGMKGLREMAEERNQNWEIALRHMSFYILQKPGLQETPIGPLVGEALEKIGVALVKPEEDRAPAASYE